jgi:hypothetical protein
MMNTDTPRTDALNTDCVRNSSAAGHLMRMLNFARDLERENAALRQKLTEARRAERERCAALCDAEAEMWLTKAATNESRQRHCLARAGAVTRAAERIRALPDEETK